MEISGKIIAVLEARSGQSAKTGSMWMSQEYVLETSEQYPKRMCFNVWGEDKIRQFGIQVGQELTVSFDIDAREYQGRWYNDIRAFNIIRGQVPPAVAPDGGAAPFPPQQAAPAPAAAAPFPPAQEPAAEGSTDDLPF